MLHHKYSKLNDMINNFEKEINSSICRNSSNGYIIDDIQNKIIRWKNTIEASSDEMIKIELFNDKKQKYYNKCMKYISGHDIRLYSKILDKYIHKIRGKSHTTNILDHTVRNCFTEDDIVIYTAHLIKITNHFNDFYKTHRQCLNESITLDEWEILPKTGLIVFSKQSCSIEEDCFVSSKIRDLHTQAVHFDTTLYSICRYESDFLFTDLTGKIHVMNIR